MIKKFLLTFLFASFCFFGISNVKAQTMEFIPNGLSWYDHTNSYGEATPDYYIIDGIYHYGKQLSVPMAKMNFGFYADRALTVGKYYDVDFVFYYSVGAMTDIVATFDNNICDVSSTGQLFGTISNDRGELKTGDGYYYTIHCSDYNAHSGWTNLSIYFPDNVDNISGSHIYALSSYVSVNFGQKQFTVAGDERSEEIKSTINEIDSKIGETNSKLNDVNESIKDTNETLNDDDTSESTSEATEFFEGFNTNTHGLTGIITAPITLIGNITSSTCTPLQAPLPFVNKNISLPCMSSIYSQYFGSFYDIYKIITFGIIAYWVCVRIFNLVKDFKNPEHDEIEVMDL